MIVRVWKGSTTKDNAEKYIDHLATSVLPNLRSIKGFEGMKVLRRPISDGFEFQLQTNWNTFSDILEFAGQDPSIAVVADEAKVVLSSFDKTVYHYEVIFRSTRRHDFQILFAPCEPSLCE